MKPTLPRRTAAGTGAIAVPAWLADDYLEGYICWREAAAAVRQAYEGWNAAERPDRAAAFSAYVAALDREQQAARGLRDRVARVHQWLG